MQLFVRTNRTLSLQTEASSTVLALKSQLRQHHDVPECEQRLVYAGRQLPDGATLRECGVNRDATVHLVLRLCGGKGGFGALLRAGGRSSVNQNTDACRDLSGRRMRHVNADKKLAEWAADAQERELEKVALQHIKQEARAAERAQRAEVDVDAVRNEHREGMASVKETLDSMVKGLPRGLKRDVASGAAAQGPLKRAKLFADSLSDSDSDESDAEELPAAAAASAADAQTTPAEATAAALADAAAVPAEAAAVPSGATTATRLAMDTTAAPAPERQPSVTSPKQAAREQSVASNGSSASAATASAAGGKAGSPGASSGLPAAPQASEGSSAPEELDWAAFDSPAALEALGMEALKARLGAAGLKCGGSLQERTARLFLLKDMPLAELGRQHFAKPVKSRKK